MNIVEEIFEMLIELTGSVLNGWMDGWLWFYSILQQIAAIISS